MGIYGIDTETVSRVINDVVSHISHNAYLFAHKRTVTTTIDAFKQGLGVFSLVAALQGCGRKDV